MLKFPVGLTDPEWKILEKEAKVSNTGVGKTLRVFEAAHKKFADGCKTIKKPSDAKAVEPLKQAAMKAAKVAEATIRTAAAKAKGPGKTKMDALETRLNWYVSEVGHMDLADRRGIDWPASTYNNRIGMR